jgi:hypothetical protein
MYDYHFDIWLLASEPNIGGFEGFDLTNPRGRFGGKRFHLACPKLGLGDAILSHTILVRSTSVQEGSTLATGTGREAGHPARVSSKGGTPFLERDYHLGFHCRALDIRSSAF